VGTAIGIDIGGTFTDIVVLDGRGPRLVKFPSTPNDPAQGVLHALAELIERGEIAPRSIHDPLEANRLPLPEGPHRRRRRPASSTFSGCLNP